jgi:isopentenyl diphosphate isomerase/L-lactate dehydrogenase-like FMN-dependent dehydrogenase
MAKQPIPQKSGAAADNPFQSLQEIVHTAHQKLTPELWDHLSGGADSETTLRRNRLALDALALRQRVLVNVADISIAVKPSIEAAQQAVNEPLIFQLYVRSGREWIEEMLDRARAAGYRALCVTVDRAWYGRRERDLINRANVREGFGDPRYQASMTWTDLVWMKEHMKAPLIVKGIATAEDARLAVDHGADVVYVSNHGGRQLDHAQGSIEVLPEVVEAVAGRAEVLVDGGVLRGTDVIKAIALGARAVGVGKLLGWALAAGGQPAIERMLELLETEMRTAMGLMGVSALSQLNPSWVRPAMVAGPISMTSAYPWYERHQVKH